MGDVVIASVGVPSVADPVHVLVVGKGWVPAYADGGAVPKGDGLDGFVVTCASGLDQVSESAQGDAELSVVVLDHELSGMGDWSAIPIIHMHIGNVPIAIVIDEMSADDAWSAMNHGITGIILKNTEESIIRNALTLIASGETYLCGSVIDALRPSPSNGRRLGDIELRDALGHLTSRQFQCVRLLTGGLTNLQIAKEMVLSEKTVKLHLHTAFRKMGAHNRADAVRIAFLHGMTPH